MSSGDRGLLERCLNVYFKSIEKLKENVKYQCLMKDKIDCDSGEHISINPQPFKDAVNEALNRCDELEIQLQGLECWVDLPIVNNVDNSANFEDVSEDAQRLVGILQQLRSALLSAVSEKALKEAFPEHQAENENREQQRTAMVAEQRMQLQQFYQQPIVSEYPPGSGVMQTDTVQMPTEGSQDAGYSQQQFVTFGAQQLQSSLYNEIPSPYSHHQHILDPDTNVIE